MIGHEEILITKGLWPYLYYFYFLTGSFFLREYFYIQKNIPSISR